MGSQDSRSPFRDQVFGIFMPTFSSHAAGGGTDIAPPVVRVTFFTWSAFGLLFATQAFLNLHWLFLLNFLFNAVPLTVLIVHLVVFSSRRSNSAVSVFIESIYNRQVARLRRVFLKGLID